MFAWFKGLPFGHYIVMAVAVIGAYFYVDYNNTKQQLRDQIQLTEQWQHAAEVQQNIDRRDTIIIRASREADRAIQEAPNADTLVPPDVASAWAAGIDSVRNAGAKPANTEHDLFRPSYRKTK